MVKVSVTANIMLSQRRSVTRDVIDILCFIRRSLPIRRCINWSHRARLSRASRGYNGSMTLESVPNPTSQQSTAITLAIRVQANIDACTSVIAGYVGFFFFALDDDDFFLSPPYVPSFL